MEDVVNKTVAGIIRFLDYSCTLHWHPICVSRGKRSACMAAELITYNDCRLEGITSIVSHLTAAIMILITSIKTCQRRSSVGWAELFIYQLFLILDLLIRAFGIRKSGVACVILDSNMERSVAAISVATSAATCSAIFFFGFVGFQIFLDGSLQSILSQLLFCFLFAVPAFFAGWEASQTWSPLDDNYLQLCAIATAFAALSVGVSPILSLILFLITQIRLVLTRLSARKPLYFLFASTLLIMTSQPLAVYINNNLCQFSRKILDGSTVYCFFVIMGNLLLMKYWTDITEDEWDDIKTAVYNDKKVVKQENIINFPTVPSIPSSKPQPVIVKEPISLVDHKKRKQASRRFKS